MTPIETKALEASAETAKTFFGKIFGPAADEWGLLKADNMRVRRLKNQIKNLEKVKAIVEKEGVTMKEINFKALFPLMEGTALEEDETLQKMWANLFTNYIDAAKNLTTHVYPDILRQLSSDEVQILKRIKIGKNRLFAIERGALVGKPDEDFAYLDELTNLIRLGIVAGIPEFKSHYPTKLTRLIEPRGMTPDPPNVIQLTSLHYQLTVFGFQFLEACTR